MDYIFPEFITKLLKKPSDRTQLEASLVGITLMVLGSLGIGFYFIFLTDMSIFFRICIGFGSLGIFFFQLSTLAMTYMQYYTLKTALGLYPKDTRLIMKVSEAKELVKELNGLIAKKWE